MGTEEFWIPAALAAVSAGAQGVNQMNANSRAQNAEVQAINNQQQYREQANSQVKNLTDQISKNNPQAAIAKETGDFVNTLRKNQAGKGQDTNFGAPTSALGPTAGGSSRYNTDVANASAQTQAYGNTNAGQMSAIDNAVRQRQNEGLAMQTLGTNLNTLNANSQLQGFVDKLRAATAGQPNPWVSMFSNALGGYADYASKNAGGKTPAVTPALGNGSIDGSYGLPGSTYSLPTVNPWFDTSAQTRP